MLPHIDLKKTIIVGFVYWAIIKWMGNVSTAIPLMNYQCVPTTTNDIPSQSLSQATPGAAVVYYSLPITSLQCLHVT